MPIDKVTHPWKILLQEFFWIYHLDTITELNEFQSSVSMSAYVCQLLKCIILVSDTGVLLNIYISSSYTSITKTISIPSAISIF
jgi:hypothetical protein